MKYLIALIGEAGSGKDTILNKVLAEMPNLHKKISHTSRPPRDYEKDGEDYYFVDPETIAGMILEGQMLEVAEFNEWFYGTGVDSLVEDKVNIGIFNPEGIESIMLHKDIQIYVFWVLAADKIRWIRQLNREEDPDINEIYRRWHADIIDFDDIRFPYNELWNETEEDLGYAIESLRGVARALEDKIVKS